MLKFLSIAISLLFLSSLQVLRTWRVPDPLAAISLSPPQALAAAPLTSDLQPLTSGLGWVAISESPPPALAAAPLTSDLRPLTSGRCTLAAVGDIFFARGVAKQIERHGVDWLFEPTRDIISSADIGFCNLECSLSTRGVAQQRRYQFRADPKMAASLMRAGFDVVSLANNHTLDFGRDALLDTVEAVEKAGLVSVGAGKDRADACRLKVVERNGLKVGFLAFTDIWHDGVIRLPDQPTVAGVDTDDLAQQVKAAKAECDCLIVSFHWGVEYMKRPTERQQMIAKLCIDNGADAILGHHPHVLQPTATYKGKPIVYSMGGFIWDAKISGADKSAIYILQLGPHSARLVKTVEVRILNGRAVRKLGAI